MTKFLFLSCVLLFGCQQAKKKDNVIQTDNKLNILYFLNTECPVCQKYGGSFKTVYKKFSGICKFYYIFPGEQKEKDILAFCEYDSLPVSDIVYDPRYQNSKKFGATVTPQVMIYNNGSLVYSGKIDDRFESIASFKQNAGINYIENALNSLRKNEVIAIKKTNPAGCFIEPD